MKKILLLASVSCLLFSSCEEFLDSFPSNQLAENTFWVNPDNVDKFITSMYAESFPGREAVSNIWWDDTMGDDSHNVWNWHVANYQSVVRGTATSGLDVARQMWQRAYANIRRAWQVLENIEKAEGLTPEKRNQYEGEARFMMAWAYNHLVNYFGDVPFVDHVLTIEESEELSRAPKAQIVEFILSQLDQASTQLAGVARVYGRITQGAAQAFKARVLLQQNRWDDVIAATAPLIGKYTLYSEGDTPYYDLFHDGEVPGAAQADEIILTIPRIAKTGAYNTGSMANRGFGMKGQTGGDPYRSLTPTGPLVDAYPMANGRLPKEDGSGYEKTNPYVNRDPRFYQSITYPGGEIPTYDAGQVVMRPYDPENAATTNALQLYNSNEPSATGFAWKKFVDFTPYGMSNLTDCANDIILMRYAEILLIRAEALAESKGLEAKTEIIALIDQLRDRVKGGRVTAANYNTQESLINLVRNERRVELCGEGLRPWDLKRWKTAELDVAVHGQGLKGEHYGAYMRREGGPGSEDNYVTVDGVARRYVETRFFNPAKHYLLPIPQKQIDLNPNLTQNPGW